MSKRIKNSLKKLELPDEVNQAILRLIEDPYLYYYYEKGSQKAISKLVELILFGKPLQREESAKILKNIFPKKTSSAFINLRPDILLFIIERYLTIINKHWTRKSYKGKSHEKKEHIKAAFKEIFPRLKYPESSKFDTRSKLNTALSFFCYRYGRLFQHQPLLRFDDVRKIYSKWKKPKESAKYKGSHIQIIDPDERKKFLEMKRNTKRITLEIPIKKDLIKI